MIFASLRVEHCSSGREEVEAYEEEEEGKEEERTAAEERCIFTKYFINDENGIKKKYI